MNTMDPFDQARELLRQFKGEDYLHGLDVLPQVGTRAAGLGRRAAFIGCRLRNRCRGGSPR